HLAMAGRSALGGAAAIRILNLAIGFVARAADHRLSAAGEPNAHVRHDPLELGEYVAPQICVARILGCKMYSDHERLAKLGELSLVGSGKGTASVFRDVCRETDLRRDHQQRRHADSAGE